MINEYIKSLSNKELKRNAKNLLFSKGVLLPMILSLVAVVLFWATTEVLEGLSYFLILSAVPAFGQMIFQIGLSFVFDVGMVLVVAPITLGVYRLAWLFAKGEDPRLSEIFYYFSPKKYGRALITFIICVLPGLLFIGGVSFVLSFAQDLLYTYLVLESALLFELVRLLVVASILGSAFLAAVIIMLPYGRLYSVIAAVVCFDSESVGACIKKGICATRKKAVRVYLFRLSFIFWILLSVLTVGMVFVLFVAPYMLISYFYYNAALFENEIKTVSSMEVTFDER